LPLIGPLNSEHIKRFRLGIKLYNHLIGRRIAFYLIHKQCGALVLKVGDCEVKFISDNYEIPELLARE